MALELARWQFGLTTIFHFFFVPVTIGLSVVVAWLQTLAYRHRNEADQTWDRLTRFFGRLFLISVAVGVVTGIVLEFQFGMNWSAYSIFVGNIFGAPLAIEGLLAFFLESTFIGLWIFGRNRLPAGVHLATIWVTSIGTMLSALFILAANAWMQHPVGYRVAGGRAVLTNFWAVMGNSTLWAAFLHTVTGAFVTASALVLGIAAWKAHRGSDVPAFRRAARLAAGFGLVSVIVTIASGDIQARLMDTQQPMKMAAAEALYNTTNGASFSLLTIGNLSGQPVFQIRVPHLLSLLATLSYNGQVQGINQVQAAEAAKYGPGSYQPLLWATYWSFRVMAGAGILLLLLSAWALWRARRPDFARSDWFLWPALIGIVLPMLANLSGWLFTELGRQPWIVYGLMKTLRGVSPTVPVGEVATTLAAFTAIYTLLGVIAVVLMARAARRDLDGVEQPGDQPAATLVY
jgi:cytochrome bd ubiquinol oxidase subunit I